MKGVGKEISKYLSDFQFRVGMSGGAKAILHSANRVLSEYHNDGSLAMLIVDFSNAFNLMDKLALLHEVKVKCPFISLWVDSLYGQASRLYIGDTHIWSATGVQQGDPLGPLLFALILHPLLHKIKDSCKLLLHAWYLDDGTVIGDSEEVVRVLDIIKESGPGLGLELNIKKTEIFWPSCNGMKLREGLFPVDIRRPSSGVKLLGGAVSRDADFISGLAMRRAANAVDLMGLLPQLHDPQSELLLLRSCMGIAKLFFGLRTCQPVHMEEAALFFDKGLRGSIENIVVCGGPFFGDLQWRLASLPIRFGGLVEYALLLKYRLMIPLFPVDAICPPVCRKAMFGFLWGTCACLGSPPMKEAPVELLNLPRTDGRSTLRPLTFWFLVGLEGNMRVDLTGVYPLVRLSSRGFTAGQTALKAASGKVTKQEKACIENQHLFIPFAFVTFGFLAPETVELLNRVQRVMHSNVITPRSMNVVFKRIGFAIQKRLAAQLVARLPSTTM
ncbi:putative reverse transcriptase domain-containing protein [Tanacetum coccineum]